MLARPILMIVGQGLVALMATGGLCTAPLSMWDVSRQSSGSRPIRLRYGRDLFIGVGYFLLIFPLFLIGGTVFHKLLYGASLRAPT